MSYKLEENCRKCWQNFIYACKSSLAFTLPIFLTRAGPPNYFRKEILHRILCLYDSVSFADIRQQTVEQTARSVESVCSVFLTEGIIR